MVDKKYALVTGGAKRVGRRLSLKLAELGYCLCVHYGSSSDEADTLVQDVKASGGEAFALQADLSSVQEVQRLIQSFEQKTGSTPVVLVNNASIYQPEGLDEYNSDHGSLHWQIHVNTPLMLSQWVANAAKVENLEQPAHIINMLDQRVRNPRPGYVSYFASKYALYGLTQTLAIELAPYVRVNGIAPGPVLPPPWSDGSGYDGHSKSMPLGHGSSPDDIAKIMGLLVETPSITGEIITSDGGQHLGYLGPDEAARKASLQGKSY